MTNATHSCHHIQLFIDCIMQYSKKVEPLSNSYFYHINNDFLAGRWIVSQSIMNSALRDYPYSDYLTYNGAVNYI